MMLLFIVIPMSALHAAIDINHIAIRCIKRERESFNWVSLHRTDCPWTTLICAHLTLLFTIEDRGPNKNNRKTKHKYVEKHSLFQCNNFTRILQISCFVNRAIRTCARNKHQSFLSIHRQLFFHKQNAK